MIHVAVKPLATDRDRSFLQPVHTSDKLDVVVIDYLPDGCIGGVAAPVVRIEHVVAELSDAFAAEHRLGIDLVNRIAHLFVKTIHSP